MNTPESTVKQVTSIISLEYCTTLIVTFFAVLFSAWTVMSHFATFFHVPWAYLSNFTIYVSFLIFFLAYKLSVSFAERYCSFLNKQSAGLKPPDSLTVISLIIAGAAIFFPTEYSTKFIIFVIGALAISIFSTRKHPDYIIPQGKSNTTNTPTRDWFFLVLLIAGAIIFSLGAHRSDLDDCSFLQIASQTLMHQDRAPLTYDTSLGHVLPLLRFAPYRISSYEVLVALISQWSNLTIYSVYYLVLPGITAVLTILVAFIFSRSFLATNGAALAATAVFLLIMFAWGETHYAYGNRVLVRIFQGKGLLIALTTPFAIITGLLLLNRPTYFHALMLALANICTIGVSSSGLVIVIFTNLVICGAAISSDIKKLTHSYLLVAAAMLYPAILALWFKLQNKSTVSLSEVGTYLPIDASFGLHIRESTILLGLLLGYSVFITNNKKFGYLIILSVIVCIINPWLAEITAAVASRNMSWRLAWAAPIPLLVSVSFVAAFGVVAYRQTLALRATVVGMKLATIGLLALFLVSDRWVVSAENNLTWRYPSAKLPATFHVTQQIADTIRSLNIKGVVLSHKNIAAWLPLALPEAGLVMPGHTYPIQLQTILSEHEFAARMKLYDATNSNTPNLGLLAKEMRNLNVELIILPCGREPIGPSQSLNHNDSLSLEKIDTISGYCIYQVHYR